MANLHVRNVPDPLYNKIQHLAAIDERSLSAEVVSLLDQGVADRELRSRQKKTLGAIRRHRFKPATGIPSSVDLIREDRRR